MSISRNNITGIVGSQINANMQNHMHTRESSSDIHNNSNKKEINQ